jgi:beta-galactosidase
MEGIAIDSYSNLLNQRKLNAGYRSIFNLVWYGLQPLELGLPDTTRPPTIEDGIFFPDLVDGKPGIQPERLGPYSTTLNPGYDPGLPAYRKWPLFDAIRDANSDPVVSLPWTVPPPVASSVSAVTSVKSIALLAGEGSRLQTELAAEGIPFGRLKTDTIADLLFVDGQFPPSSQYLRSIQAVLSKGGTVVVWGTAASSLDRLNALMPWPLQLTDRHSSSLLPVGDSRITAGLKPSDLYFSETTPPDVLTSGLGGSLVTHGTVLLQAPNTDWLSWNKQPEYAKTAMVLRSERETKPSGIALLEVHTDIGRLIISNLPAWSPAPKFQGMVRTLLRNMGVPLDQEADAGYPFLSSGKLAHTLAIGRFPLSPDGVASNLLDPASIGAIKEGDRIQNERWAVLSSGPDGSFDLNASPLSGADSAGVVYLSFWLQSPRSLDNLLLEPNVPKLDLSIQNSDAYEIFLNGKSIYMRAEGKGTGLVSSLPLQQGWNHILLRIQRRGGSVGAFQAQLQSSDPEYLQQLKSSLEKP